jgi:hypothetical protein
MTTQSTLIKENFAQTSKAAGTVEGRQLWRSGEGFENEP